MKIPKERLHLRSGVNVYTFSFSKKNNAITVYENNHAIDKIEDCKDFNIDSIEFWGLFVLKTFLIVTPNTIRRIKKEA